MNEVLTTRDVGLLQPHTSEDGEMTGAVLVDRGDLLATTMALETAQTALTIAAARTAEETARAEKAESERDRLAVDAMTALIAADICTPERGYVAEPVCLTMDIGKLARERDAARRELAELALEVGYGERPEGQSHIIHADGKTLAGAWLLERKGRDQAEADRDIARATFSEMVTALEACTEWMGYNVPSDGWGCRDRRADADRIETLKTANAALDKAKEAKP